MKLVKRVFLFVCWCFLMYGAWELGKWDANNDWNKRINHSPLHECPEHKGEV